MVAVGKSALNSTEAVYSHPSCTANESLWRGNVLLVAQLPSDGINMRDFSILSNLLHDESVLLQRHGPIKAVNGYVCVYLSLCHLNVCVCATDDTN